jgi:hypothetical protein
MMSSGRPVKAAGLHRILDRRRFEGPPARRSRAGLFSLFYLVDIRHQQLLLLQTRTR